MPEAGGRCIIDAINTVHAINQFNLSVALCQDATHAFGQGFHP